MPRARDAARGEQVEKLAAAAADVEHVGPAVEQRQIGLEPRPDHIARSAELILEAHVLVRVERAAERLAARTSRTPARIRRNRTRGPADRGTDLRNRADRWTSQNRLDLALQRHEAMLDDTEVARSVVVRRGNGLRPRFVPLFARGRATPAAWRCSRPAR